MNYIQKIKEQLRTELKWGNDTDYESLLDLYATLVLVTGEKTTLENVHDAWSAWQNKTEPNHRSLKPFSELTKEVQELDRPYTEAIIKVAKMLK